jgi:hypothetical protein
MVNYANSKIYAIYHGKTREIVHIGSTTDSLTARWTKYMFQYNLRKRGRKFTDFAFFHGPYGMDELKIDVYEYYPCDNHKELYRRTEEIRINIQLDPSIRMAATPVSRKGPAAYYLNGSRLALHSACDYPMNPGLEQPNLFRTSSAIESY